VCARPMHEAGRLRSSDLMPWRIDLYVLCGSIWAIAKERVSRINEFGLLLAFRGCHELNSSPEILVLALLMMWIFPISILTLVDYRPNRDEIYFRITICLHFIIVRRQIAFSRRRLFSASFRREKLTTNL
jgi:hypothetical protein